MTVTVPPLISSYWLNPTDWNPNPDKGWSGIQTGNLDKQITEWVREITVQGHAMTHAGQEPINHRVIGVGAGHDDARFADVGNSQTAWAENEARGVFLALSDTALQNRKRELEQARRRGDDLSDRIRAVAYAEFELALGKARREQEDM